MWPNWDEVRTSRMSANEEILSFRPNICQHQLISFKVIVSCSTNVHRRSGHDVATDISIVNTFWRIWPNSVCTAGMFANEENNPITNPQKFSGASLSVRSNILPTPIVLGHALKQFLEKRPFLGIYWSQYIVSGFIQSDLPALGSL